MLKVLTLVLGNKNYKWKACIEYRALRQKTKGFSTFQAKCLVTELDYSDKTLINDLINKCYHTIQDKLATGKTDSTDFLELTKCCLHIKQAVKKVSCNKYVQDQNVKQNIVWKNNASRNNGFRPNKAIVSASGSNAAFVQANLNSIFYMARLSQLHIQINTLTTFMQINMPAPITSSFLRLIKKEIERLKKFGKCFNCKQEKHVA